MATDRRQKPSNPKPGDWWYVERGIQATQTKSKGVVFRVRIGARSKWETRPSLKEARAALSDQRRLRDDGLRPVSDRRTFAEFLTAWLDLKAQGAVHDRKGRARVIGPRTLADYRLLARDWIIAPKRLKGTPAATIGTVRVARVTHETLNTLYRAMESVTTVGTINGVHRFLGQVFVEAERKGIVARNPTALANVPQRPAPSRVATSATEADDEDADASAQAMDEDQAHGFLVAARTIAEDAERDTQNIQHIPERLWSARWHLAVCAGLRPGEALGLQWKDIELDAAPPVLYVRRSVVRVVGEKGYRLERPKTKAGRRTIPLVPELVTELKAWRREQKRQRLGSGPRWQDLGFVLTSSLGTPLHDSRRSFERVCAKAGLGEWGAEPQREHATGPLAKRSFATAFRIYDCRHTFVSLLLMHDTPINVVRELAGHETAAFTLARYGHALPRQTQAAAVTLSAVLFQRRVG
jgi:integrase